MTTTHTHTQTYTHNIHTFLIVTRMVCFSVRGLDTNENALKELSTNSAKANGKGLRLFLAANGDGDGDGDGDNEW